MLDSSDVAIVFPTRVGMNRVTGLPKRQCSRVPHSRGDEPGHNLVL